MYQDIKDRHERWGDDEYSEDEIKDMIKSKGGKIKNPINILQRGQ